METNLLLISGSLRKESYNSKLVREAGRLFGTAKVTFADLRLPLYDGDLEDAAGLPMEVLVLQQQMQDADAVVISTPEYNSNLSGVLKNALDWVSRGGVKPLADKPVAILSAAAGRTGGARAQYSLRHCLTPFQPRILQGPEVQVAGAAGEFNAEGRLTNERYEAALTSLMQNLRAMI